MTATAVIDWLVVFSKDLLLCCGEMDAGANFPVAADEEPVVVEFWLLFASARLSANFLFVSWS